MNAYEIRLELLKLAVSIESERIWSERNRLEQDWATDKEKGIYNPFPKLPSVLQQDVISVAEELDKFISSKN